MNQEIVLVAFHEREGGVYFLPARVLDFENTRADHVHVQLMVLPTSKGLRVRDILLPSGTIEVALLSHPTEVRVCDTSPPFASVRYEGVFDETPEMGFIRCVGVYVGGGRVVPLVHHRDRVRHLLRNKDKVSLPAAPLMDFGDPALIGH